MISYEKKNKVDSANAAKKPATDKKAASKVKEPAVKGEELLLDTLKS